MPSKHKITEAGLTVFARYGFRQATMELVADEAGMSRQALYRHFPNKESLFSAAIDMLHACALDAAGNAAAQARATGQPIGERLVEQVLTRSEFLFMRLRGTAHGDELTQENLRLCGHIAVTYGERFSEQLAATIEAAIAEGTFALRDEVTPRDLARFLIAAARGIKSRVPPIDIGELRDEFRAMLPLIVRGAQANEGAGRRGALAGRVKLSSTETVSD